MGVLGLVPFIQKYCPQVIQELPQRLKTLSGKTIAIDGTLITQRLHFAPMPYANRHILGWYRVIRELKEANVGVICVFDGEERSSAKQPETDRRRKMHRVQVARGTMEADRLQRLHNLTKLLNQYQNLPEDQKDRSANALRNMIHSAHVYDVSRHVQFPKSPDSDISQKSHIPLSSSTSENDISGLRSSSISRMKAINALQNDAMSSQMKDLVELLEIPHEAEPKQVHDIDEQRIQHEENGQVIDEQFKPKIEDTHGEIESSPQLPDVNSTDNRSAEPASKLYSDTSTLSYSDILRLSPETSVVATPVFEASPEELQDPENQFFAAFEDFFELPRNAYLDTYGKISALHPYALEPPYGVTYDEVVQAAPSTNMPAVISSDARDVEGIMKDLASLFKNYERSIPVLMATPFVDISSAGSQDEANANAIEQYAMSKNQMQLTIEEGSFWKLLTERATQHGLAGAEEILDELARRSENLTKSYEVRNSRATSQTYKESKHILRAMGVPCIDTNVPYEAEALAASLVHNGYADYVASEDTDVLVYEAPLLRNITNRQSPLTVLSGAEIRRVLQLDRASYVDFALLLGTDFSERVKNVGPNKAIKLIREHGRIEDVIANDPKFSPRVPPETYLNQVAVARVIFETLPPIPDAKLLQPTETNDEVVAAVLAEFGVYRASLMDWNHTTALDGNYYNDNPRMS